MKILKIFLFFLLINNFFINYSFWKSFIEIKKIINLNEKIKETSGLLNINWKIWTFNDSSWKNELLEIDKKTWKILNSKQILNSKNIDWEAITQSKKYIFIWDIWNNYWNRKNLQIYKINKKNFLEKNLVFAEKINFSYKEKNKKIKNKKIFSKFDSEAMIFFKGNIYIFSKWWWDYNINIYKINPNLKNQIAKKINSKKLWWLITWATIKNNKIYLVGYKSIFVNNPFIIILSNFKNDDFFSWKIEKINIFKKNIFAQIEAIEFIWKNNLILTCEKNKYSSYKKATLFNIYLKNQNNFLKNIFIFFKNIFSFLK